MGSNKTNLATILVLAALMGVSPFGNTGTRPGRDIPYQPRDPKDDLEKIQAAEEKRQRKMAKRLAAAKQSLPS